MRDMGVRVRRAMNSAHSAAGVESLTMMFDPVTGRVKLHNTPGLDTLKQDLNMEHRLLVFWEYQRLLNMSRDYFTRSTPEMLEPLAFEDMPGGQDVQVNVTAELLSMALPKGGARCWIAKHTADQLRGMKSSISKLSYETWPVDLPLQNASDMEPHHLAAAYKWAVRWLAGQDLDAVVTRIAESGALTTPESAANNIHWHRCMALRLVRGVVGKAGTHRCQEIYHIMSRRSIIYNTISEICVLPQRSKHQALPASLQQVVSQVPTAALQSSWLSCWQAKLAVSSLSL